MLRKFFSQLLISVIFEDKKHSVRSVCVKNKQPTKSFEKSFDEPKKAYEYILSLSSAYRLFYVAVLLKDAQGLLPSASLAGNFGVKAGENAILPLGNAQIYTKKSNIEKIKTAFAECEIDLIFSPFALLYRLILQHLRGAKDGKFTLYALRHNDYFAIIICENDKILYGKYCDLSDFVEPQMDAQELKEMDEFIENDELGEGFSEIGMNENSQGLDDLDDILGESGVNLNGSGSGVNSSGGLNGGASSGFSGVNFNENSRSKGGEKSSAKSGADSLASALSGFGGDMDMCAFIFESVKEFYENPLYNAKFLERLIIFQGEKINDAVLDYIEGEIFIRPEIKAFDAFSAITELMRWELEI